MKSRCSCVINADGYYITFVMVVSDIDTNGTLKDYVQFYTLKENEQLLDMPAPTGEYAKPRWVGTGWEETATLEEIEVWKQQIQSITSF